MATMQVELISPNDYDFNDLLFELSLERGEDLSDRTLRYWISNIGIEKNDLGFYERSDLEILKLWLTLKPKLRTINNFKAFLRRRYATERKQAI